MSEPIGNSTENRENAQRNRDRKQRINLKGIALSALLLSLLLLSPAFTSGMANVWAGLLHLLLPLLAFLTFSLFGRYAGVRLIIPIFSLCALILLIKGEAGSLPFSAAMLLAGYLLYRSAQRGYSALRSGAVMFSLLAFCWGAALLLIRVDGHSAYHLLVIAMQEAVVQSVEEYRRSGLLPAETMAVLEAAKKSMLEGIPLIIPGVIGTGLILLTWFSEVVGSRVLRRLGEKSAWQPFSLWQVADWLIWFFIAAVVLLILPQITLQAAGINLLMLLCSIYCLQGLSLTVYFFQEKRVRVPVQILLYTLLLSQAPGVFLLMIAGISSTWINFRKAKKETL